MAIFIPPTNRSSHSSRFGRQRRHIRKLAAVFRILAGLCALVSVGFFISSCLEEQSIAHRQRIVGVVFLTATPVLLALGLGLDWWKHRFYGRGRGSRSHRSHASASAADEDGPAGSRHGSALIIALLLTTVLTGILLHVQWQTRRSLAAAQRALTHTTLHQAAAEGIRAALQRLAADDDPKVDHDRKPWATPQLVTNPVGVVVAVRVTDENRYFDWNNLSIPPLGPQSRNASDIATDLMNLSGDYAPLDRLGALMDWLLDANSSGLWETPFYRQQLPPYEAANRPLYALSELLWVNGFSRDLFRPRQTDNVFAHHAAGLLDSFAVVPVPRERPVRININTASRDVLLAVLGIDHGYAAQALLALRESGPIRSLQPINRMVEPRLQDVIERYLDVRSLFFCIEAEAEMDGQSERIRAVAHREESGALGIVQWIF